MGGGALGGGRGTGRRLGRRSEGALKSSQPDRQ